MLNLIKKLNELENLISWGLYYISFLSQIKEEEVGRSISL